MPIVPIKYFGRSIKSVVSLLVFAGRHLSLIRTRDRYFNCKSITIEKNELHISEEGTISQGSIDRKRNDEKL